jgi:peptide/nickel transport system permease protein
MASRLVAGARISLLVGAASLGLSSLIGVLAGLLAAWYGGRLGEVLMRVVDIQLSLPFLVIAISLVAIVGAGLTSLVVILALWYWAPFARLTYGVCLAVNKNEYITAAIALGCSDTRILRRHVLPNVLVPLAVFSSYVFGQVIVLEGSLSFLGFGVQPPHASLGSVLSEGRGYLDTAWWIATFPGLAIMVLVIAANAIADSQVE